LDPDPVPATVLVPTVLPQAWLRAEFC